MSSAQQAPTPVNRRSSNFGTRRDLNMLSNSGSYLNYVIESCLDPSERFSPLIEAILDPSPNAANTVQLLLRQMFKNPVDAMNYFTLYKANCYVQTLMGRYSAGTIYDLLRALQIPHTTNHTSFSASTIARVKAQLLQNDRMAQDFTEASALSWQMTKLNPAIAGEPCYQLLREMSQRMYAAGDMHTISRAVEHVFLTQKGSRVLTQQVLHQLRQHLSIVGGAIDLTQRRIYHRHIQTPRTIFAMYNRNVELALGMEHNGWQATHGTLDRLLVGDTFISDTRDLWTYGGLQDPPGMTSVFLNTAGEETIGAPDEPNNPTSGNTPGFGPVHSNAARTAGHVAAAVPGVAMHGGGPAAGAAAPVVGGAAPVPAAPAAGGPPALGAPIPGHKRKGAIQVSTRSKTGTSLGLAPAAPAAPAAVPAAAAVAGAPAGGAVPPGGGAAPPPPPPLAHPAAPAAVHPRPGDPATVPVWTHNLHTRNMELTHDPFLGATHAAPPPNPTHTSITTTDPAVPFADAIARDAFMDNHVRELNLLGADANNAVYLPDQSNPGQVHAYATIGDALMYTTTSLANALEGHARTKTVLDTTEADKTRAQNHIRDRQTQIVGLQGDVARLTAEVATAQGNVLAREADITAKEVTITDLRRDLTAALAAGGNVAQLNMDLAQAQNDLTTERAGLATAQAAWTAEQTAHRAAQANLTAMTAERDTARTDLATAQGDLTTTQGERDTARNDLATVRGELATSQGERGTARTELSTAQAALLNEQTARGVADANLSNARAEIVQLQTRITQLSNELSAERRAGGASGTKVADLQDEVHQLQDDLRTTIAERTQLHADMLDAQNRLMTTLGQVAQQQSDINDYHDEKQRLQDEIDNMEKAQKTQETRYKTDLAKFNLTRQQEADRAQANLTAKETEITRLETDKVAHLEEIRRREDRIQRMHEDQAERTKERELMQSNYTKTIEAQKAHYETMVKGKEAFIASAQKDHATSIQKVMEERDIEKKNVELQKALLLKQGHDHATLNAQIKALEGNTSQTAQERAQALRDLTIQKDTEFRKMLKERDVKYQADLAQRQKDWGDTTRQLHAQLLQQEADLSQLKLELSTTEAQKMNDSQSFQQFMSEASQRTTELEQEKEIFQRNLQAKEEKAAQLAAEVATERQRVQDTQVQYQEAYKEAMVKKDAKHTAAMAEIERRTAAEAKRLQDELHKMVDQVTAEQANFTARVGAEKAKYEKLMSDQGPTMQRAMQLELQAKERDLALTMQERLDKVSQNYRTELTKVQAVSAKEKMIAEHAQGVLETRIRDLEAHIQTRNDESMNMSMMNTTARQDLQVKLTEVEQLKEELGGVRAFLRQQAASQAHQALLQLEEMQEVTGRVISGSDPEKVALASYISKGNHIPDANLYEAIDAASHVVGLSLTKGIPVHIANMAADQTRTELEQTFADRTQALQTNTQQHAVALSRFAEALTHHQNQFDAYQHSLRANLADAGVNKALLETAKLQAAARRREAEEAEQQLLAITNGDTNTSSVLSRSLLQTAHQTVSHQKAAAADADETVIQHQNALNASQDHLTTQLLHAKKFSDDSALASSINATRNTGAAPSFHFNPADDTFMMNTSTSPMDQSSILASGSPGFGFIQKLKSALNSTTATIPEEDDDEDVDALNSTVISSKSLNPAAELSQRQASQADLSNAQARSISNVVLHTPPAAPTSPVDLGGDLFGVPTTPTQATPASSPRHVGIQGLSQDELDNFMKYLNGEGDVDDGAALEAALSTTHPTSSISTDDDWARAIRPGGATPAASRDTTLSSQTSYSTDPFMRDLDKFAAAGEAPSTGVQTRGGGARSFTQSEKDATQRASLSNSYWNFASLHKGNSEEQRYANQKHSRSAYQPAGQALAAVKMQHLGQTIRTLNPEISDIQSKDPGDPELVSDFNDRWNDISPPLRKAALTKANQHLKEIASDMEGVIPGTPGSHLVNMLRTDRAAPAQYKSSNGGAMGGPLGPIAFKYLSALDTVHAHTQMLKNAPSGTVPTGTRQAYVALRNKIHAGLRDWLTYSSTAGKPETTTATSTASPMTSPAKPKRGRGKAK
jgi:hypothetical protein